MVKALLINGADDLEGGSLGNGGIQTHIPNDNQGWGRVNLKNIVVYDRHSSRGPKICIDDAEPFTAAGQFHTYRVSPVEDRPMRITLVWTDAPASQNAVPTRVNDLDLSLRREPSGPTYKGNYFNNGCSISGGEFQDLDNVECVYLANPSGVYEVCVYAASLSRDARWPFGRRVWQDFALVMDNAVRVS
ncbi:MAG: peptidase and in, kexin, sedolisin [Thermomicrobiales bacterium]|nr:peptidase and in, kexin, sedolisin [Thermomicrobiales bacterium]